MPWVRFDDDFPVHRKVAGLSDAAFRLHVSAIFWSARNLTDGYLPREDLGDVSARVRTPGRFAAECVRRGVWHSPREQCESERCIAPVDKDGWVIHDYLEFQPSKEQVMRDREAARIRQERWKAKRNGTRNGVNNAVNNGVTNATPSRPAPKRSGAGTAPDAAGGRAGPPGSAARSKKTKPPWCGTCHELTRQTETSDGTPMRCPRCHPYATGIEAESWQATHKEVYGR